MKQKKKLMSYIPNYVDLDQFKVRDSSSENLRILFPRRAQHPRGYWFVSYAIDKLMEKYSNIEFHFVGYVHQQDIKNDMNRLISKYKGKIIVKHVEPEEMPGIYNNTDITIIPTLYGEGTSLSCLEAMASGNTLIVTNIGGLPNLVFDNFNGLLINPDKDDLLNALEKLINDKSLRSRLSANGLEVVKSFSQTVWLQKWREMLASKAVA